MLFGTEATEIQILAAIQNILGCDFLDFLMPLITALGNAGAIWILLALLMMSKKDYRKTGYTLSVALILCLIAGNLILKPLIARPRPFMFDKAISLLISAPKDFSFPSGHTMASFSSAFVLMLSSERVIKQSQRIIAIILAVLISFSRMYLFVHYPTDIIAGIIVSWLAAKLAVFIVDLPSRNKKKLRLGS